MSSNFSYIFPKNGLAKDAKINKLIAKIIEKVGSIPNHNEYRMNLEMLTMVCCMIEHGINNKKEKKKIDKKDIVFQVYNRLWNGMSPQNLKDLEANIEYLHENGQIVKKKLWSVIKHSCIDWFERKILN